MVLPHALSLLPIFPVACWRRLPDEQDQLAA
jgi:hypothetical protein